jgi:hypothetical protein
MVTDNPQGGGRRVRTAPPERLRQAEDALLIFAGFKPVARWNSLLWVNGDGVCYGRKAALQVVERKQPGEGA